MPKPTIEEIVSWYDVDGRDDAAVGLAGKEVIYAVYECGGYSGGWWVLVVDKDGKLWLDQGAHCSCFGPSWNPKEVTVDQVLVDIPPQPCVDCPTTDRDELLAALVDVITVEVEVIE